MTEAIRNTILTNWHPMRWVALGIGLFTGISWFAYGEPLAAVISVFFLFQAATNTGCMVGHCSPAAAVNQKGSESATIEDIEYEEIKN